MSRSIRRAGRDPVSGSISSANCTRVSGVRRSCEDPGQHQVALGGGGFAHLCRWRAAAPIAVRAPRAARRTRRGRRPRRAPARGAAATSAFSGCARRRAKYAAASNTRSAQPASSSTENCRAPTRAPGRRPPTAAAGYRASATARRLANCVRRSLRGRRARAARSFDQREPWRIPVRSRRPAVRCGLRGRCCATVPAMRARGCSAIERLHRFGEGVQAVQQLHRRRAGGEFAPQQHREGGGAGQHQARSPAPVARNTPREARFMRLPGRDVRRSPRPTPSAALRGCLGSSSSSLRRRAMVTSMLRSSASCPRPRARLISRSRLNGWRGVAQQHRQDREFRRR